ncbi:MAG: DUF4376 domain-containing protein [Rhizobiales bacterium]|nr:DUF4376 domain-containing protein [Hyphomicrobiales bacterium]
MYAKVVDDQLEAFPYTDKMLRLDNPTTSFPVVLTDEIRAAFNMLPVAQGTMPAGKNYVSSSCDKVAGVWTEIIAWVDPIPPSVVELKEYLAELRWEAETGGIMASGMSIDTSRESQAMLTSAYLLMQRDPERVIRWKTRTGTVNLNAEAITSIADIVANHVQDCFDLEANTVALIDNHTITTFDEIDNLIWPS